MSHADHFTISDAVPPPPPPPPEPETQVEDEDEIPALELRPHPPPEPPAGMSTSQRMATEESSFVRVETDGCSFVECEVGELQDVAPTATQVMFERCNFLRRDANVQIPQTQVECLVLLRCFFDNAMGETIAALHQKFPNITKLKITESTLDENALLAVSRINLVQLEMTGCAFDGRIFGWMLGAQCAFRSPKLRVLRLTDSTVRDEGALAIAAALSSRKMNLVELDLRKTLMRDQGYAAVVDGVRKQKTLQVLDLRDNYRSVVDRCFIYFEHPWLSVVKIDHLGSNATFERTLALTNAEKQYQRAALALMGNGRGNAPAQWFMRRDGDHAIWTEISSFVPRRTRDNGRNRLSCGCLRGPSCRMEPRNRNDFVTMDGRGGGQMPLDA